MSCVSQTGYHIVRAAELATHGLTPSHQLIIRAMHEARLRSAAREAEMSGGVIHEPGGQRTRSIKMLPAEGAKPLSTKRAASEGDAPLPTGDAPIVPCDHT